ncbi:hypothetical protein FACS189428_2980 [Clostridia bacterium]|nr:hypothetical protein FACS189428_2980 [Clostridia bacterium]
MGFTGTLFSLLTFGIEMMIGKVKADQLLEYEYFMTTPQFKEIKDIAHTCAWMVKRGNPGAAFLTTLLQSPHPHLYLLEVAKEMKADDIPFLESYEKTIPELLHLGDNNIFPTLPLRWAMIYSGNKANTLSVEKQRVLLKSQNKNYSEWFLQQDFGKVHSHLHELFANQDYYNVMENGMEEMSIKLVYMFTEIYKQGPRKEHIQLLIHTLNTLHHLYNTVEEDSDFYDEFLEICTQQGIPPTKF